MEPERRFGRTARRGVSPPSRGLGGAVRGELNAGCSPPFRPGGEAFWAEGRSSPGFQAAPLLPPLLISEGKERAPFLKMLQAPLDGRAVGEEGSQESLKLGSPPPSN